LLDFEAKSKGVNIILSSPKEPVIIQGDETDFKIAVINIILNAIKATQGHGSLKIKIKQSAQHGISISFTDNGIGISPSNIANIFNPFFSEGKQETANKGSGLGLAITKSIIEKNGGTIHVTSTEGKGSCFTLSFPTNKKLAKK
jgi:signal transduction histidine kinase